MITLPFDYSEIYWMFRSIKDEIAAVYQTKEWLSASKYGK
jgi:hypothetical protein